MAWFSQMLKMSSVTSEKLCHFTHEQIEQSVNISSFFFFYYFAHEVMIVQVAYWCEKSGESSNSDRWILLFSPPNYGLNSRSDWSPLPWGGNQPMRRNNVALVFLRYESDRGSPRLPIFCRSKRCLSPYSHSLFCDPLHNLVQYVIQCFPLRLSCEFQILRTLFPHYVL